MNEPITNSSSAGKTDKALIYVVDDEAMLLELAAVILEPRGYKVETFRDAELALETFRTAQPRPALIITDYAMKPLNGIELLEACRRLEPVQKVLLVSGTVGSEILGQGPVQPDSFLPKPFHGQQLIGLVESLLGG